METLRRVSRGRRAIPFVSPRSVRAPSKLPSLPYPQGVTASARRGCSSGSSSSVGAPKHHARDDVVMLLAESSSLGCDLAVQLELKDVGGRCRIIVQKAWLDVRALQQPVEVSEVVLQLGALAPDQDSVW